MSTEPTNTTELTASEYITKELVEARQTLKNVQLYGSIIVGVLCIYLIVVTAKFSSALQPENAAMIVTGLVQQQVDDHGDEFAASIKEKIPEMIHQAPDYAAKQLPIYREQLEAKVEADLTAYAKSTSGALDKRLDEYFTSHKDEIKTVLAEGAKPEAVQKVGGEIKQQIIAYLGDKPATGPSLKEQIDDSLKSLKEVESTTHKLAVNKNLTPQEKQTRRALAIIAQTVTKENLKPLPIKEALGLASDTISKP
ncbi:MAG TPA: hypothetical protein VGK19_03825 [Capsulimonadaceae bacterium]|jgi:hypothetical protein